jgi:hypothetical protein
MQERVPDTLSERDGILGITKRIRDGVSIIMR